MGTGTRDMIRRCVAAGLTEPEFSVTDGFVTTVRRKTAVLLPQPESRPESRPESLSMRVLGLLAGAAMAKAELASRLGQKEVSGQLNKVVRLLLDDRAIEYTVPDKPQSRLQKYRLTEKGRAAMETMKPGGITSHLD
jgi:ATP-dependent DNA helicase RecG